jgi:hypothetical protein
MLLRLGAETWRGKHCGYPERQSQKRGKMGEKNSIFEEKKLIFCL